jgi:hypothetical protein
MANDLKQGFEAFAEQFEAQVAHAGAPTSEHALHFALALGFQAAYEFPIGTVIFERPAVGNKRTDIWIGPPLDLAIELKYQRPIPSRKNRPYPQHFGSLLADFNKVLDAKALQHAVVLVTDEPGHRYISGASCFRLLPLDIGHERVIERVALRQLSHMAASTAEEHGVWKSLKVQLSAKLEVADWILMMWTVSPAG